MVVSYNFIYWFSNLKQNGRRRITTFSTSWRTIGGIRERPTGSNGIHSRRGTGSRLGGFWTRLDGRHAADVGIYSRWNGRRNGHGSKWRVDGHGWRIILDAVAGDGDARRYGPKHDAPNGSKYARNDSRTNGLILDANATTTNDVVTDALIHWPTNRTTNRHQPNVSRPIASLPTTALRATTICKYFWICNNLTNVDYSNNKWWDNTTQTSTLTRMASQSVKKCTSRCFSSSRSTEMRWDKSMVKRWWLRSNTCSSNSQRRIPFKIRSRRLFPSALKMMLFSVILSSQLTTRLCTLIQLTHLSILWIWDKLSGRDLKKSFRKTRNQECTETLWTQEISSKVFLVIAGSWDHSWFKAPTQSFWTTWLSMMVSSMVLQFSNSSKMVNGNTLLLILEFPTTPNQKLLSTVIALTSLNSGFHWWKRLMPNCIQTTKNWMVVKWTKHWLTWLVVYQRSSISVLQKLRNQLKAVNSGRISRSTISKASYLVVPTQSRTRMVTSKKAWVTQVSCGIMLSVFNRSEILMVFNWLESETHGVKVNGLVNSLMKMKLGMTIKVWRKNLSTLSKMMVTGGWNTKISAPTSIKCIFARFSQLLGHNSRSTVNGMETLQVVHIQLMLKLPKKTKKQQ